MAAESYNILINARSGTVLDMGEDAIRAAIEVSGIGVAELFFSAPEDMSEQLQRLSRGKSPLLVGGGDGTIREVAKSLSEQVLIGRGKPFGILPFGTMNLMARDLGLETLQDALNGYARGSYVRDVDAGVINGELFLCCASIGTMPQAAVFREENRTTNKLLLMPQLFMFVVNHLEDNKRQRIRLALDRRKQMKFRAAALVISANRFADSDLWTANNFKRATLDGGELALYATETKSRASHLRLMAGLLTGGWLKDPDLSHLSGQRATILTKRRQELVSIDGEVMELNTPLACRIRPKAVRLLVPTPSEPADGAAV